MCHSPTPPRRLHRPAGRRRARYPGHIARYAPRIYDMAVASEAMPLGNETGMTQQERAELGAWIKAGAKTR